MRSIQYPYFGVFFFFFSFFSVVFGAEKRQAEGDSKKQTVYIYEKLVGTLQTRSKWVFEKRDGDLYVIGKSNHGRTKVVSSLDWETKEFVFLSGNEKEDYKVYRNGAHLIAIGQANGRPFEKTYKIGNSLWIQEFDFSLKPFIRSSDHQLKFYIIHPKKLSMHHMVAKKQQEEKIVVQGKEYLALKVKITLTGFKGMFWKADAWFEKSSGDLIKYVSNEGPNTPTSVVTLVSKKSASTD